MDIADYIPVGYKNAISRQQLVIRSGMSDRAVRQAVKDSEALICNLSDGRGYFIPSPTEERYVRAFRAQESHRGLSTGKRHYITGFSDDFYVDKGKPRIEVEIIEG